MTDEKDDGEEIGILTLWPTVVLHPGQTVQIVMMGEEETKILAGVTESGEWFCDHIENMEIDVDSSEESEPEPEPVKKSTKGNGKAN